MAGEPFGSRADGEAQRLRAEALGEPGQRRFRMLAVVDGVTHVVWMEKQQLQALGLALEQLLDQLPDRGPDLGGGDALATFQDDTLNQFRAGRMELGYDERRNLIVVAAHDMAQDDEDAEPTLRCRMTRTQARDLSAEVATVVAAGRPRCTMCGAPMGPGPHVCPQQNGHLPHSFEDTEGEIEVEQP
jgi:uncharacterized repeat protein (TIGR03847 family)